MLKRVLVTGGALRLGAVICEVFARAGWHVICQYRTAEMEAKLLCDRLQSEGFNVECIYADLSTESARIELMDTVADTFGLVACLINNASQFIPDSGLDFEYVQAMQQMEVNCMAPISLARLLARRSTTEKTGMVACAIHILDQKVFNLNPDYFSYTLSKLALERAVALQAQALAPKIRVCGVAPGLMYLSGPQSEGNFALASQANLLRKATNPLDVANACMFLATTESMTGTTICVDGGQHLVPLPRDIMFVVDDLLKS